MEFKEFKGQAIADSQAVFAHDGLEFVKKGKVRDLWRFKGAPYLVMFCTDRISVEDQVLPTSIPGKGMVLNGVSRVWFDSLWDFPSVKKHTVDGPLSVSADLQAHLDRFKDRLMVVEELPVIPVECVIRGYLYGGAWQKYQANQSISGITLPVGLQQADYLKRPIFTPTTKADDGHDEELDEKSFQKVLGAWLDKTPLPDARREFLPVELGLTLSQVSFEIYHFLAVASLSVGIILADTKLEFGLRPDGSLVLVDEIGTPDSSRFWPQQFYKPGGPQESLDKQPVRDYLKKLGWKGELPAPALPPEVVRDTQARYFAIHKMLVGLDPW